MTDLSKVYDEGFKAYGNGIELWCPLGNDKGAWDVWVDGWLDAKRAADNTKKLPVGGV
jgi:hypothetical protein